MLNSLLLYYPIPTRRKQIKNSMFNDFLDFNLIDMIRDKNKDNRFKLIFSSCKRNSGINCLSNSSNFFLKGHVNFLKLCLENNIDI